MNTSIKNESRRFQGQSGNYYVSLAATLNSTDYSTTTPFKGLYVGVSGDIEVVGVDGTAVVLPDVPAGCQPIGGIGVKKAGTDALAAAALFAIF